MSLNPGLQSRFPLVFEFPDYSVNELMEIAGRMLKEKQYELSREAGSKLKDHLIYVKARNKPSFSNGRYIRNIIEKAVRSQAMRLLTEPHINRNDLMMLHSNDFKLTENT